MVSVITCTKRPGLLDTLYRNFSQQHEMTELILVPHGVNIENIEMNSEYLCCTILHLPKEIQLGTCLNEAVDYLFV